MFSSGTTLVAGSTSAAAAGEAVDVAASIGADVITSFTVADDQFELSETIFGLMGNAATAVGGNPNAFLAVADGATTVAGLGITATSGGIVHVLDEGLYFIEKNATLGAAGVDGIAATEKALIATLPSASVTGTLAATDFDIVT